MRSNDHDCFGAYFINYLNTVPYSPLNYTYDELNRVTERDADTFAYNQRSEVVYANIQPAHTNSYNFGYIGNNISVEHNGAITSYTVNQLNQYTAIDTTELSYDPDGNLTHDGAYSYTWDAENRLVAVYEGNTLVISNAYDHASRRVLKVTPDETRTFLYDGWNLVQETITTSGSTTTNQYIWGKDLSGTLQGAGGVGGLLAVIQSRGRLWKSVLFPLYDNNGNITHYIHDSGVPIAAYRYDAFGNIIPHQYDPPSFSLPHRFSTKYYDPEIDLYYYGYRFYSPSLMRWLNRDPIGENGGDNIYQFNKNASTFLFDILGFVVANRSAYPFAIYFGVGPAAGNPVIAKMINIAKKKVEEFTPAKDADLTKRCLLSLGNNIMSSELRDASATYDELYFNGHGEKSSVLSPDWKSGMPLDERWSYRTIIAFSDGWKSLSDVLTLKDAKASVVVPYVCYDYWLDDTLPSGMRVFKPLNSKEPNPSWLGAVVVDAMISRFREEKCCAVDVAGP